LCPCHLDHPFVARREYLNFNPIKLKKKKIPKKKLRENENVISNKVKKKIVIYLFNSDLKMLPPGSSHSSIFKVVFNHTEFPVGK